MNRSLAVLILLGSSISGLLAQAPPQSDPFEGVLFTPDVVMRHQQALALSADQRDGLIAEIRQAQTKFTDLEWKLQGEMQELRVLLNGPKADEARVLGQLDKVLALEREMKRAQVGLLVRIKNRLTPEQQAKLREFQSKAKSNR